MQQRALPRPEAPNVERHRGGASSAAADSTGSVELDALKQIEEEYDRRMMDLVAWRLKETERVRACSARTDFAVGSNQFQVQHGGRACTAVSVAAALYVLNYIAPQDKLVDEVETMLHLPWEDIVRTGAQLWSEYMSTKGPGEDVFVECGELLACGGRRCATTQRRLRVVEEMAGHTDSSLVAGMDPESSAISLSGFVERIPIRTVAVVTATSADTFEGDNNRQGEEIAGTLAVIRLASDNFWIYDSHGGTVTQQAALLCLCGTVAAAAAVIRDQLPSGLYSATVYKRQGVPSK